MKNFQRVIMAGVAVFGFGCSGSETRTPDDAQVDENMTHDGGASPAPDSGPSRVEADAGDVCETWIVEYELSGSKFGIRDTPFGAGDATNDIGPGTLQLSMTNSRGECEPVRPISTDMLMAGTGPAL